MMYDITTCEWRRQRRESVQQNETVTALCQVTQDISFDIRKLAQMAERALDKREVSGSNPEHSM